jgi:hypothetical protein
MVALLAALLAMMMTLGATAALAGEVTGNGKSTAAPSHAKSICAFSGQNDDPDGNDPANGPPGRTQSFGQDVRNGYISPHDFNPGIACRGGSDQPH